MLHGNLPLVSILPMSHLGHTTGPPHRSNQALLFDHGFKVDDETRFWSAEPPGGPRALRPSEFDRHRPRPVSYPGTQPHLGQM